MDPEDVSSENVSDLVAAGIYIMVIVLSLSAIYLCNHSYLLSLWYWRSRLTNLRYRLRSLRDDVVDLVRCRI